MKRLRRTLKKSKLNPWVYDILTDYDCRIEVYCGGAGSGKSYGAMQKMLLKAMNEVRTVLVVRKVAKTLYHSVFRLTVDLLLESGMYPYAQIKRGDGEIHLANGSKFIFKGIDDPEKIKSITGITDIVVEEATELTEQDFLQLDLRLRPQAPHPQIFVMFNPVSKASWVYRYFFEKQREDCRVIRTSYRDNLFLSKEYVKRLQELEQLNPAYYRIYTLGEFVTLDKLVFPQVEVRLISPEEVEGLEFFCGMDFGYVNDPTAIIWGWYDKGQRRILVTGEYFAKGMNNRDIANVLTGLGLRKECITADSSEPKSIEELKRANVRCFMALAGLTLTTWWWTSDARGCGKRWRTTPGNGTNRGTDMKTCPLTPLTTASTPCDMGWNTGCSGRACRFGRREAKGDDRKETKATGKSSGKTSAVCGPEPDRKGLLPQPQ